MRDDKCTGTVAKSLASERVAWAVGSATIPVPVGSQ